MQVPVIVRMGKTGSSEDRANDPYR
jgi:hypothetical protein